MNSPSVEYDLALKALSETSNGPELILEAGAFSQLLCETVFNELEGKGDPLSGLHSLAAALLKSDAVRMAFCLMGRTLFIDVLEKNCILLVGRLIAFAQSVDALSLDEKLLHSIQGIRILASQAHEWNHFLDESTRHVHDKKERRSRRHVLQQEMKLRAADALPQLWEAVFHRFLPVLLPNGVASLYLPPGVAMFLPKLQEMLNASVPQIGVWLEGYLFQRELKFDLLYRLYEGLREWLTQDNQLSHKSAPLPSLSAHIVQLEPAISPLCHAFIPSVFSLGSEVKVDLIASKAVEFLGRGLMAVSLEGLLVKGLLRSAKMASAKPALYTERELDALIDGISSDERIIRGIVQLIIPSPDIPLTENAGTLSTFFNLVLYGLKASATEVLTQGALAAFNWQDAQQTFLERFRWFVLSPYCDRAVLQVGGGAVPINSSCKGCATAVM